MKRSIAALSLLLFAGCAARVSVTGIPPLTVVNLWGSNRALEKKAAELRTQLTGKQDDDRVIWQKIEAIRGSLTQDGYLVQRDFVLPNIVATPALREQLRGKIFKPSFDTSPLMVIWIGMAGARLTLKGPTRLTVIDRKKNLARWHSHFQTIDKEARVEQPPSHVQK